jgi:hypothetical protein
MAFGTLHAAARCRFAFAGRANLLPLNLQSRYSAPHSRPEVHVYLVLKVRSRLRLPRAPLPSAEHSTEDVPETSAKAARLLLPSAAASLKVRKIKAAKIKRNFLPRPTA